MADPPFSRRDVLRMILPLPALVAACRPGAREPATTATARPPDTAPPAAPDPTAPGSTATSLAPTPSCDDGEDPTPEQTAGPFFAPDSPERISLIEPGLEGDLLVLEGSVLWTDCQPVAGALLDFWQADADGAYDNQGHRLRGHQFADREGRYRLETVVPGNYRPRTRHIHVRIQAPGQPILTTQLYFPGEARNAADGLFDPRLLMALDGERASFDFVLRSS